MQDTLMDMGVALAQFGGDSPLSIIFTILFFAFIFLYPKLMIMQTTAKLEQKAKEYEIMSNKAKKKFLGRVGKKDKKTKQAVERMSNFFAIPPASLDTRGIVNKLDKLTRQSEHKLNYFIDQIAPEEDEEGRANLQMGIKGVLSINQITKVVRHFIEIIRKTKNLQLAMILQMQIPFIDRMIKSQLNATEAFLDGHPVGDSIGPLYAASFMDKEGSEILDGIVMHKTKVNGRRLYVVKAKGPGSRIGIPNMPKAIEKLIKKYKISKVISVDAAGKLEGETTGKVAEGVGFGMGDSVGNPYKHLIEDVVIEKNIPMETIAIKQSMEDAIEHMPEDVLNSEEEITNALHRMLEDVDKGSSVVLVGVGNTVGIPNSNDNLDNVRKRIRKKAKQVKKKKEAKENQSFWSKFFGKKKK